ncbi:NAD(P)-dependent oxidoreductase [Amycolatopsis sp. NPDC051371]|uniref:NAD-dependent epimerase/dehydratase family protein n=1 Tax=Amycolatopsis sp. NPDC051371 TaxID=3155800 RepID=UPI0034165F61
MSQSVAQPGGPVLVTGAAGFLGARVVEQLVRSGREVRAVDLGATERSTGLSDLPGVTVHRVDVRDTDVVEPIVRGTEAIVHLAALRPKATQSRPHESFQVNVEASYGLLRLAAENGVRRIVFGSSHSVYGSFAKPRPFRWREDDLAPGADLSMYGASKIAVEAYLNAFAAAGGPSYVSARLATLYGPHSNRDNSLAGIMLDVLAAVGRGERPVVRWAPAALHDLVYVDDAARAVVAALDLPAAEANLALNIVGEPVSSVQVFETLVELGGGDPAAIDWRPELSRYQLTSPDLMRSVLGPVITTDLRTGLGAFVDWAALLPATDDLAATTL